MVEAGEGSLDDPLALMNDKAGLISEFADNLEMPIDVALAMRELA